MKTHHTDSGIYQISNLLNGKRYVGSAKSLKARLSKHVSALNIGNHHAKHLQSAFNKYGTKSFEFTTLLKCSPEDLIFYEQRAIDAFKPEYNSSPTAGNTLGVKCSPERRRKISDAHKGKKLSAEHKAKIAPWGRIITEETRARLSTAQERRVSDPEWKRKVSEGRIGMVLSESHRQNISVGKKGLKPNLTDEVRFRKNKKIGEANRTRPISDEFRANASKAQKKRKGIERFELGGDMFTVLELSEHCGICRHTLRKRLNAGWSVEKSVSVPVRGK
jgi:group I intron endonuclease